MIDWERVISEIVQEDPHEQTTEALLDGFSQAVEETTAPQVAAEILAPMRSYPERTRGTLYGMVRGHDACDILERDASEELAALIFSTSYLLPLINEDAGPSSWAEVTLFARAFLAGYRLGLAAGQAR